MSNTELIRIGNWQKRVWKSAKANLFEFTVDGDELVHRGFFPLSQTELKPDGFHAPKWLVDKVVKESRELENLMK
jgi:hypothetical protein